ncbi:LacI family DNA-binding transcriptional regulator [Kitasatospora cineracea]|uniref:LacI family DNA-binding transcriptional regulator n=1 Tax=Kitasatospora TaxID=2063 RepID=UPI0004C41EEF|nr:MULTISPECIES: LacI family DNA-binding transcriptional regulator [unclassified Kitasatospora]WAL71863.1 LacI family DNA-binding transcriptional regulator [Kitasatospora sp. YST-16]WNW37904.1 LacI family DNA-binding transcriptional regulator [Streptomyces sp. Li-HN-5-13]
MSPTAQRPDALHPGAGGRATARPTLEEVAALAGVGRGTVSRVINGSPRVSAKAREAVQNAIAELGYVPNRAARTLVTSRTDSIALVVPEAETRLFSEPYFSDIISGVSAELAETDMQLLLILVRNQRERDRLSAYLTAQRVDGVLVVSVHRDDPLPGLLESLEIPSVLAGRRSDLEPLSYVHADNAGGARMAVRHLLRRGCTQVATLTGPLDMEVAQARLGGYRRALEEAGHAYDEELVGLADFTEEGGRVAMRELLARRPELDGVFCASDVMAAGAMQVLRAAGRRIPDDVAVIGFDDSIVARHTDPPMTSVRQPIEEMGRTMARLLLDEIHERGRARRQVVLATELIVRDSA